MLSSRLNRDETAARVVDIIKSTSVDVLVVDTFPRGLAGELADLLPGIGCRKVLVHRDLNPRYATSVGVADAARQFDRILVPGESAPFETYPQAIRTAPWFIRDAHELLTRAEARRLLAAQSNSLPIVAVIGCGRAGELEQMRCLGIELTRALCSVANVRFVTPCVHCETSGSDPRTRLTTVNVWPFLKVVRAVSVVVGGGGYNTVHEARATRTPLVALARPRLYDRQQCRLLASERVADLREVRERVAAAMASKPNGIEAPPATFDNGVHEAITAIEDICS
jgi:hypothetical protein